MRWRRVVAVVLIAPQAKRFSYRFFKISTRVWPVLPHRQQCDSQLQLQLLPVLTFCINCCPTQCQSDRRQRAAVFQFFSQFFFSFCFIFQNVSNLLRFVSFHFILLRFALIFVTCRVGVVFLVFCFHM